MMNIYLTMILIAALVTLVFESGFWSNLDRWVNSKWQFYHLPQIFSPLFNIVKGYILKLIEWMGRGL